MLIDVDGLFRDCIGVVDVARVLGAGTHGLDNDALVKRLGDDHGWRFETAGDAASAFLVVLVFGAAGYWRLFHAEGFGPVSFVLAILSLFICLATAVFSFVCAFFCLRRHIARKLSGRPASEDEYSKIASILAGIRENGGAPMDVMTQVSKRVSERGGLSSLQAVVLENGLFRLSAMGRSSGSIKAIRDAGDSGK